MANEWAVVTGASAGLGIGYAERLAQQGSDVLLVARRQTLLEATADTLRRRYGVRAEARAVDLSSEDSRAEFVDELRSRPVHTLINNAGFGTVGPFSRLDADRVRSEVSLNVGALTDLSHAVAGQMVDRGRGAIVNVASTAAFQPMPEMAVYAATKGYVLQFTVALWQELYDTGVRALAVCPGPTNTSFFANAGDDQVLRMRRTADQVVDTTFRALARHQPFVVDGFRSQVLAFANRFAPRGLSARVAALVMRYT